MYKNAELCPQVKFAAAGRLIGGAETSTVDGKGAGKNGQNTLPALQEDLI